MKMGDEKSYFYRCCKSCYESRTETEINLYESSLIDSLISKKKEEIKKLRRDKKLAYLKKYYREILKPQRAKRSKTNLLKHL
jgi:hypothetical protein